MDPAVELLKRVSRIAVVGMSRDPQKAAHAIPLRLRSVGFEILPVNPAVDEIAGLKAHAKLADVPPPIDLVLVFRPSAEAPGIAREAVAAGARALWLQQGLVSPEARKIAESGGLDYVEDRCTGVEVALNRIRKE